MRHSKSILFTVILCLLFSSCMMGLAEDEIVSAPVDIEIGENEAFDLVGMYVEEEDSHAVEAAVDGEFLVDDEGVLTKYNGFEKNIVIPDYVTVIGDYAFLGMNDIAFKT